VSSFARRRAPEAVPTPVARPDGYPFLRRPPGSLPAELDDELAWRARWLEEHGANVTADTPRRPDLARRRAAERAYTQTVEHYLAAGGLLDAGEVAFLEEQRFAGSAWAAGLLELAAKNPTQN
jgi:hypothetical protein